ncbi:MAG: ABC transporter ATP-binding protein [Ottowia sp.]|uniref:ABC transporter ATP-binding protein n=1 Tax=unclassified Ottowia TaxID=2645081 RepID=UPI003C2F310B
MNSQTVLKTTGLCAGYGRIEALHGVNLELKAGQLVALVGANGAGKTTLLRTISGLIQARAGQVELLGQDITRLPAESRVRAGLAQVLEGRQVFGPLSVLDNLRLGGYTHKPDPKQIEDMFNLFPILRTKKDQAAWQLSGGQQQMLAMARALMSKPKVLLLDEPSMGLAPLLIKEVFHVVKDLKESGIPILLVEQNARAALAIADHAYVLETGHIALSGPAAELAADERVRSAYLGV